MKFFKKLLLFSFIVLAFSNQLFSQKLTKPSIIMKTLKVQQPENSCISITNSSDTNATFSMKLNNKFYTTDTDIANEIRNLSSSNKDSLFFFAWQFMCKNFSETPPLIKDYSSTTLMLYFNSVGSYDCGRQANVLYKIWNMLGYKSRIWHFPTHNVPEVLYNNKWQMLDPTYRGYYLNENNEIAGVEELVKNPEIITNPKKYISEDWAYSMRYRKNNPYKTPEDNILMTDENIPKIEIIDSFLLQLPPHSKILFPGVFVKNVSSYEEKPLRYFANYKLIIPPSWKGIIKNYLIIADIRGSGFVNINNKDYDIGSSELKTLIANHEQFIPEMLVKNLTDTLEIIYFINPILSEIKEENTITFSGKNINNLQTSFITLPDSSSVIKNLRQQYFYYNNRRIDILTKELSDNDKCIENVEINDKEQLLKQLNGYLNCLYKGEKEKYVNEVMKKIESVLNELPENYNYKKIFFLIKHIPLVLVFFDLEYADKEFLYYVLTKPAKEF